MALTTTNLIAFLAKNRSLSEALGPDTPLFSSGLLDSASMVELMVFVEQETGLNISPGDVTLENFDTVARITAFVAREQG